MYRKTRINKKLLAERQHSKEELLAKNIKMISTIENTPPKVNSWANLKWLKIKT